MVRTSSQVPAAICRVVRCGPRRGDTYQNPIVTFSGWGSGSSFAPSVACASTFSASSGLVAVTVTSAPRFHREISSVHPSPSASVALRSSSRAARRTLAAAWQQGRPRLHTIEGGTVRVRLLARREAPEEQRIDDVGRRIAVVDGEPDRQSGLRVGRHGAHDPARRHPVHPGFASCSRPGRTASPYRPARGQRGARPGSHPSSPGPGRAAACAVPRSAYRCASSFDRTRTRSGRASRLRISRRSHEAECPAVSRRYSAWR